MPRDESAMLREKVGFMMMMMMFIENTSVDEVDLGLERRWVFIEKTALRHRRSG